MRKRMLTSVAMAMVCIMLTGCGGSQNGDAQADSQKNASADQTWEISMSTPLYDSGVWGQQAQWFADQVNEKTDGHIKINIFYANALGEQKDMFTQLANNEIEMLCDGTLPIDYYAPEYGFIAAPYLLKGPEHLQAVIDSEYFQGFKDKLADNNILISGIGIRNSRNTMSTDKFEWDGSNTSGLIIRTPDNALYVDAWSKLGANVQIMGGGEIYSALQTGVLNAFEGPYDQFLEIKLEELGGGYLYETEHVTEFYAIYTSKSWMESIPEEYAQIINDTAQEAMENASAEVMEKNDESRQTLIDAGYTFVEDFDSAPLFEALAPVWEEKFETDWNVADYDDIMSLAK